MNQGALAPLLAFIVSSVITLVALAISLILWLRTRRFLAEALQTTGVVLHNELRGSYYSPRVQFTAVDGKLYEFTELVGSRPPRYKAGETVPVYYHRQNFNWARAARKLSDLYYPAIISGIVGGGLFLMLCLLGGVVTVLYLFLGPMGGA